MARGSPGLLPITRLRLGIARVGRIGSWQSPYAPAGAVQNKVADAASAEKMSLTALLGHACGRDFKAGEHLAKHPEYAWLQDVLRDMDSRGWTKFVAK